MAVVSVWLSGLDGVPLQAQNVNQQHDAASLVKLPVAIAAYRLADRGELDLDAEVEVHAGFASAVEGETFTVIEGEDTDPETWAAVGEPRPLRELVRRSLTHSGNLAADLVLERVGLAEVAAVLADAHCSPMTEVVRGIDDAPAQAAGLRNLVTAHDVGRVLAALARGELASVAASAELEAVLCQQRYRDGIPAALPEDVTVANKTGWDPGVLHDAAVVRSDDRDPLVLCVLTTGLDEEEAEWRLTEVARFCWDTL